MESFNDEYPWRVSCAFGEGKFTTLESAEKFRRHLNAIDSEVSREYLASIGQKEYIITHAGIDSLR